MPGTKPSRSRKSSGLAVIFCIGSLAVFSISCGGPSSQGGNDPTSPASTGSVELTDDMIRERINGSRVRDVPEESGSGEMMSWVFYTEEPKEIVIVEKTVDGPQATVVLDVKTVSHPKAKNQRYLAGQIRTEWRLETGWVLRRWEIVDIENISMKFRKLPKPPEP